MKDWQRSNLVFIVATLAWLAACLVLIFFSPKIGFGLGVTALMQTLPAWIGGTVLAVVFNRISPALLGVFLVLIAANVEIIG